MDSAPDRFSLVRNAISGRLIFTYPSRVVANHIQGTGAFLQPPPGGQVPFFKVLIGMQLLGHMVRPERVIHCLSANRDKICLVLTNDRFGLWSVEDQPDSHGRHVGTVFDPVGIRHLKAHIAALVLQHRGQTQPPG